MKTTTLALYDNEEQYDAEFQKNLDDCKSEFSVLYKKNIDDSVFVCAPGIEHF
jgi:hypothetical protein